jgi:hypothetical protein
MTENILNIRTQPVRIGRVEILGEDSPYVNQG